MLDAATATTSFGVLVVETGTGWVDLVADCLRREDILVSIASGGAGALRAIVAKAQPQMIILEAGDSVDEAMTMCRHLRSVSDAHIAVLTADCDTAAATVGIDAGADEVFSDPLRTGEIACRVRQILNRPRRTGPVDDAHAEPDATRRFGPLAIDVERRLVFVSGQQVDLTRMEFDILVALSQRPDAITTRQQLLSTVWGRGWPGNPGVIDVHIGHLRRKLGDDPARPRLVVNVRGVGYRLPAHRPAHP